jgi:pimeloyl-ACP methyl ester carboxylesterase
VGHGPRRGVAGQTTRPEDIVFNFANPASARGTMAQGAADLHAVTKYLASLATNAPPELPPLDVSNLVFWGHSQGATEGALFLAQDRTVEGALLSGASAQLVNSLTTKQQPVDIAGGLWLALNESSPTAVSSFHPVLALLQAWTDPVDPVHFGQHAVVTAVDGTKPAFARHVFQVWGKDDLYTPRKVQASFARSAKLAWVGPAVDEFDGSEVTSASGNVTVPRAVTAAMRQYVPATGADGHFVVFESTAAKTDAARFIGRVLRGETPTIPEP